MEGWVERLTGSTRGKVLRLLRSSDRTVPELAEELGLSGNAVRGHMAALQRDGMVEPADLARETGGKPARRYRITREAEELFPKAYALVLGEVLEVLEERLGPEELRSVLSKVGLRSAGAASPGGGTGATSARVRRAVGALESVGAEVSVEPTERGPVLRGSSCPLSAVVQDHPLLCELVRSLVEEVSGVRVEEVCQREARPRCGFRLMTDRPTEPA